MKPKIINELLAIIFGIFVLICLGLNDVDLGILCFLMMFYSDWRVNKTGGIINGKYKR